MLFSAEFISHNSQRHLAKIGKLFDEWYDVRMLDSRFKDSIVCGER
jgi:hypothetical protein